MNTNYNTITIRKGKEQAIKRFHPWVFTGAIEHFDSIPAEGSIVRLCDYQGQFLALGHYSEGPSIAIRIISFDDIEITYQFWLDKLKKAYNLRQLIMQQIPKTNVYRLVHGEADGLPGLIIDIYDNAAVVQCHSIGMWSERENIKQSLIEIFASKLSTIYNKSEETMPSAFQNVVQNGFWLGADSEGIVEENGYKFIVNWVEGQKTGFFIDQRQNRLLLKQYAQDRTVCNMFGYSGAFSVYALGGRALKVDTVDASKTAVARAAQNIALNFPDNINHRAIVDDAFSYLDKFGSDYDLIVIDPPAFAKRHTAIDNAIKGYKRINQIAMEKIRPNGIIFTFSCSQAISMTEFKKTVFVAAANAKRDVAILNQLSQPADHPINIFHPEGEYLKGLVLKVV